MIDGELASIVVQAGAIGVLIFGIWILGFKVIPENRKAMDMIQTNFLTALRDHEDGHRTEVNTLIEGHKTAVDRISQGQDERLKMLDGVARTVDKVSARLDTQTNLLMTVIRNPNERTRSSDTRISSHGL